MNDSECIPYKDTGYFTPLILDYLKHAESLKPFIEDFPSLKSFESRIQGREDFSHEQRQILQESLRSQYKAAGINIEEPLAANIDLLGSSKCFTVTTGHQNNILSGPLYFVYKILGTIRLSEELKKAYPDQDFVPVFWMATEDHDFEEIASINLYGGKLQWRNDLKGAVGRMPTFGMGKVLDELEEHLGSGKHAQKILQIFRAAYHDHDTLAQATRYLTHELFKDYGLVILDGDDANLKKAMIPYFMEDLLGNGIHERVEKSSQKLAQDYFAQIYPREINLFYLQAGIRERIEQKGDQFKVLNTNISFSETEIIKELNLYPERFSPNVVLRPLYQEVILPNLAYIGGGGEIAYWLQLKDMFDFLKVPYPLPILRNSVMMIPEKWQNRLKDLDLEAKDLFQKLEALKKNYIRDHFPEDIELERFEKQLEGIFTDLEEVANLTDRSMLGAVNAQRQKQLKGIQNLRKKLIRAEKRQHSAHMEKLERIYFALFPKGALQERHDNIAVFYADHGQSLIEKIHDSLDPLDFRFTLINL